MPVTCLTGARMNMRATILHQNQPSPDDIDVDEYGEWVKFQDPLTNEIVRRWEPYRSDDSVSYQDYWNAPAPANEQLTIYKSIPCIARGIVDGGIRVAGTTERFGESYENIDFVKMWVPANIRITKRDRVTNIADVTGHVRWLDEEYYTPDDPDSSMRATVFNVNGVTPLFNAFNRMTEQFVLLERVAT